MLKINLYHPEREKITTHFTNLVRLAMADGIIDKNEKEYLYKLGKRFNMTPEEVDKFIENPPKDKFVPPFELQEKYEQIFDLVALMKADGVLDEREIGICKALIIAEGFEDEKVDKIMEVISALVSENADHETGFEKFRKTLFRKF